ncbi:mCG117698, isoform CRA_a [Mus musculus]|nr:mCG117698, isoform CRA_a [Mus musculus]EDL20925.1 mCG117698, isoform CRA_a [Mus musculus]
MCLSEVKWSSTLGKTWRNEENKWLKQNALQWRDKKRRKGDQKRATDALLREQPQIVPVLSQRRMS